MLVIFYIRSLVANTPFLETIQLLNHKGGSEETRELDLFWKSQRAFSTSSSESKFEFNPLTKTILILGSEFPTEQFDM